MTRGFTLIELLIVIAIVTTACAFTFGIGFDDYRRTQTHSTRDTIVNALMHARAEAMANECFDSPGDQCTQGRAHGVEISNDKVTVFQVNTATSTPYFEHRDAAQDEITSFDSVITIASTSAREIVFLPLSGDVTNPGTLVITNDAQPTSTSITVSEKGTITW